MRIAACLFVGVVGVGLWGCSDDGGTQPPAETALLDPPPASAGVQISTGDFDVEAGTEVQGCYFFKVSELQEQRGLPADEPLILHRTQIAFRDGSHHMNIFRVRTVLGLGPENGREQISVDGVGPCADSPNWADWPLIANSQSGTSFDWTYPDGVGNELEPDEWIMIQAHYVNATTQKTKAGGRVDINLWSMKKEELTAPLGTLFATKQSIRICRSNPSPTFNGTCQFNNAAPTHVIGANGHFHSRGKEFGMYVWDGMTPSKPPEAERFYTSDAWDDPPMDHTPQLDRDVPALGGIYYTCGYQWVEPPADVGCEGLDALDKEKNGTPDELLDCCYTFGNTVETGEHCNVFAYYYPKQDDVNCF